MSDKLNGAMLNTLRAVEAGKAVKRYTGSGNTFERGNGVGSLMLRQAEANGWIEDGPNLSRAGRIVRREMALTKAGEKLIGQAAEALVAADVERRKKPSA